MELDSFHGTTILVTGGAGFVGSYLVHTLTPHVDVTVIDNLSNGTHEYVPEASIFVEADLRSMTPNDYVADADIIFHEAALPSIETSVEYPIDSHEINADIAIELLNLARKHDTRVVMASSAAIYGVPKYSRSTRLPRRS